MSSPEGPEFWIQSCGYNVEENTPSNPDSVLAGDYKLYLQMDLLYLEQWLETFCQDKFLMSFADKVTSDAAFRYDWLQVNTVIPKSPGQHLNEAYYSQQQFSAMLTQSSNIFQRIAIGWEQMDYEKTDSSYYTDHFTSTTSRMENTLCQLDRYLAEKRMPPAPNPTRAIMPNELRSIASAAQRDERNFRIIKEYVNALEYYIDAFSYFESA